MAFIRSVLHLLFMVVTLIPWATAVLIARLFVRGDQLYGACRRWLKLSVDSGTLLLGIHNRVSGTEHLPQPGDDTPTLLLVKHQSTWETFSMAAVMPRPLAFVFKRELLYIPFFGWVMGAMDMIYIDRSKGVQAFRKLVTAGKRQLRMGKWIIMFPEGTRTRRGEAGDYKSGGARLAVACGAQIIPIAVTSAKCWPKGAFVKKPGIVDISIGPPIAAAGRSADDLNKEVAHWIESEMRRLDPEAYVGQPPLPPYVRLSKAELRAARQAEREAQAGEDAPAAAQESA
ncbi:1-acyl-sn-glycerol-3-phosphate acyltransferase [Comamonas serinivorans]|uniref:1-acyl-sn-glycerol-3-phosphate acyltransferase n=1 Tax=Comamonas serinivorans TaxID=1082851 RepID=A0A1Y0EJN2_9BURK|nr:lysophospholipid acyltransferase family protein [Comamonas serinivorans]ARU03670.1 1-acyl-sn-glycerol-3-phosphate acyltransferase [Comamonas serinivorans]